MLVFSCKTCGIAFTSGASNVECNNCISFAIKSTLVDRDQKLEKALQLLKELNADFDTQEHSYVGRDSDFHKRIKEIIKEQE
jgi:hypothetical protein